MNNEEIIKKYCETDNTEWLHHSEVIDMIDAARQDERRRV